MEVAYRSHFKYDESHWNPSEYPTLILTLHMNTSMLALAPGFYWLGSFPLVRWYWRPITSLNSSSFSASFLSTLLPNTTNGTSFSSGTYRRFSSSPLASCNLSYSAASTIKTMPSTDPAYSLHTFLA